MGMYVVIMSRNEVAICAMYSIYQVVAICAMCEVVICAMYSIYLAVSI